MLVDRNAYNASIAALAAAKAEHKKRRAEYVTDIRNLGTSLRKGFCSPTGVAWVHVTHEVNIANPQGYGIDVAFAGDRPDIANAIVELMREEGWEQPHVYDSNKYATHIRAY